MRGKKGKKDKTHRSSQERQGCKQLLLGGREGQAGAGLREFLNGRCWRVALLSHSTHRREARVRGELSGPQLLSSLLMLALEPDGADSAEGRLPPVV